MILLLLALGCVHRPAVDAPPGHLTVLHTNDMHGHFLPETAEWIAGRPQIGGFEWLDAEVRALRAERGADGVLLLDGGDILTGTPLTDIEVDGAMGGAMIDFMEHIGYDGWALGNHEFDKGLDNLGRLAAGSTIPILSSNVRAADGLSPLLSNQEFSHVYEVNGLRVGVIGATTEGLGGLMDRGEFGRLKLLDVHEAVRAEVEALDPNTDLIVVVSHIGVDDDTELARRVPGIDLIVGGHSHTAIREARRVRDTWVVQAGSYTRSLGVVDMVVEGDAIASLRYELRDLVPRADREPSAEVRKLVATYRGRIDAVYGEVIARAPAVLGRDYHHESALGRWITDVLRDAAEVDVAFYNGGGLRADLDAGEVTRRALYECFPFGNEVVRFEMGGDALLAVLLRNATAEAEEKRGFLSLSGVRYTWRLRDGAPEIVEAWVGGEPLDLGRAYTVATNSYVAEHWEKHIGAEPRNLERLGRSDFDAAVAFAAAHATVADPGDKRAVRLRE